MPDLTLTDFEGRWLISRRIENAIGPDATFRGTVTFAPGHGGLVMSEAGEMVMDGQVPMQASRRYIWRTAAQGIDVFFDDGRYFHHIGTGAAPKDRHDCAPDLYQVAYDFGAWPLWSAVWHVTGPRKDYVMRSEFRCGS